jgi:hypothetical protein
MNEAAAADDARRVFRLADHVRAASDRDGAVILDLRSGRYLGLNRVGSAVLQGVRHGLTLQAISAQVAAQCQAPLERVGPDAERFLARLVSQGLVQASAGSGAGAAADEHPATTAPAPPAPIDKPLPAARVWVLPAYLALVAVDLALRLFGFGRVHRWLHRLPPGGLRPEPRRARRLARAVDGAAAFYLKRAWCLERSLATLLLMRLRRWPARLVLGARRLPFGAHAWVEIAGEVVNDDPRVCGCYVVLERCG